MNYLLLFKFVFILVVLSLSVYLYVIGDFTNGSFILGTAITLYSAVKIISVRSNRRKIK